jgi:hypothetical protein
MKKVIKEKIDTSETIYSQTVKDDSFAIINYNLNFQILSKCINYSKKEIVNTHKEILEIISNNKNKSNQRRQSEMKSSLKMNSLSVLRNMLDKGSKTDNIKVSNECDKKLNNKDSEQINEQSNSSEKSASENYYEEDIMNESIDSWCSYKKNNEGVQEIFDFNDHLEEDANENLFSSLLKKKSIFVKKSLKKEKTKLILPSEIINVNAFETPIDHNFEPINNDYQQEIQNTKEKMLYSRVGIKKSTVLPYPVFDNAVKKTTKKRRDTILENISRLEKKEKDISRLRIRSNSVKKISLKYYKEEVVTDITEEEQQKLDDIRCELNEKFSSYRNYIQYVNNLLDSDFKIVNTINDSGLSMEDVLK